MEISDYPGSEYYGTEGRKYLEIAILKVLTEAEQRGSPLVKGSDIARKTGLMFSNGWVARGLLYAMRKDGRVAQLEPQKPFEITAKGKEWLDNNVPIYGL